MKTCGMKECVTCAAVKELEEIEARGRKAGWNDRCSGNTLSSRTQYPHRGRRHAAWLKGYRAGFADAT